MTGTQSVLLCPIFHLLTICLQEGWTAQDMLPIMNKSEKFEPWPDDPLHGYSGPLAVSYGGTKLNIAQEWLKTAESRGIPIRKDLQDMKTGFGSFYWPKWIDGETGKRQDVRASFSRLAKIQGEQTAHAYLHSQRGAKNLSILTTMHVDKVILEGDRAVAVDCLISPEFHSSATSSQRFTIRARKCIVLSAGALATPCILQRSGIGSPEVLKRAGVNCLVDLPGVGENYQGQLVFRFRPYADKQQTTN